MIEGIIRDMNRGLFNFTDNGKCSSCGKCCSNILPLSQKDISRIKKYIKAHNIKSCNHFLPTANPMIDMTCPFRDNDKKICTIYAVRPAICMDFKCDKAMKGYMPDKAIFQDEYIPVFVSQVFFGK